VPVEGAAMTERREGGREGERERERNVCEYLVK